MYRGMNAYMLHYWVVLVITLGFSNPSLARNSSGSSVDQEKVRGIIISTHGIGRDWGKDVIVPTMADIKAVGANWVAIHPYARIFRDGSIRYGHMDSTEAPAHWIRPIQEAHAQGLKIYIKPHLAHWRSGFSWRGEITFKDDEAWARFWTGYRSWILKLASACKEADGFVVGTELDKTLHQEDAWRRLIAEVRAVTDAPLTYGANWTDYQRVPFWDALDLIGIQAYFPITEKANPTAEDIQRGWQKRMAELRAYGEKMDRRILFTELGYNQSYLAAREPWNYRVDGEDAQPVQEACWRAALQIIEVEPQMMGALLWKWFPYPRPVGRNFVLATPHIMTVVAKAWEGEVPTIVFDEAAWEARRRERRRRFQKGGNTQD